MCNFLTYKSGEGTKITVEITKSEANRSLLKETEEIHEQLNPEICIKLIKKKLPLKIRLLNKIFWHGNGVYRPGYIVICFAFNDDFGESFRLVFNTKEIKNFLETYKNKEGNKNECK